MIVKTQADEVRELTPSELEIVSGGGIAGQVANIAATTCMVVVGVVSGLVHATTGISPVGAP